MIKINKAGYIYILLTIMIGFAAVNTANNLLYIVTSALLSYMLISGVFGRRNLQKLDVSLDFPEECFADTLVPLAVSIHNRRRFMPAFLIRVSLGDEEALFPFISAGSVGVQYIQVTFPKRGIHRISGWVVASSFPFNFFTRYRKASQGAEVVVFPKLQRCALERALSDEATHRGDVSTNKPGFDSDILSIRNYVSGDPIKYVSWKSTAKTGSLKTKEMSSPESPQIIIDVNRMKRENLETTLSCAAFLVVKLIRSNVPVGLILDNQVFRPDVSRGHKIALLTELALHDPR